MCLYDWRHEKLKSCFVTHNGTPAGRYNRKYHTQSETRSSFVCSGRIQGAASDAFLVTYSKFCTFVSRLYAVQSKVLFWYCPRALCWWRIYTVTKFKQRLSFPSCRTRQKQDSIGALVWITVRLTDVLPDDSKEWSWKVVKSRHAWRYFSQEGLS